MNMRAYVVAIMSAFAVSAATADQSAVQNTAPAPQAKPVRKAKLPRTADGRPDLSGTWEWATITSFERPPALKDKAVFASDAEVADYEANYKKRWGGSWFVDAENEEGTKVIATKRTSVISDPPDGKLPPLTAEALKRAAAEPWNRNPRVPIKRNRDSLMLGPEDSNLSGRCIMGMNAGPPILPGTFGNLMQLFQTRDSVVLLTELIHTRRFVPFDNRPVPDFPQWSGHSRGRWEGDTLIVETKQFMDRGVGSQYINTDANMRVVERFSLFDADTLLYQFTVDDPTVWTRPWSGELTMERVPGTVLEFSCHEANVAMTGALAGARVTEREAAEGKKP